MINKYKFIIALLAVAFLFPLSSCSDFGDTNVDPNNPTQVPADGLVSRAQFALNNRLWSRNYNAEWGMLMVQHWTQNEYTEEGRFDVDGNNFDLLWTDMYANVLKDINAAEVLVNADEVTDANIIGNRLAILSILEIYAFHNITDAFGAVPYKSILDPFNSPLPSYDSQEAIYSELVSQLTTTLGTIDVNANSFDSGDIIYNGNMSSWKKFGTSLLMRIAMRMSNVDEAAATSVINGIDAGDLITSNADNTILAFSSNPSVANPLYVDAEISGRDDFSMSTTLLDILDTKGDPRILVYADTNASGNYVGITPTLADAAAFDLKPTSSRPHPALRTATAAAVMIDAAEVNFMLAEAYERGMLTGDAAAAYNAGVTASMEYWGFNDGAGAITDYLTANPYDAANWKESIGTQKWLAFYMNGPQAWAEWRRLGYPVLAITEAALLPEIPVRLPYPISEQTRNGTSLGAVDGGDPNDLSTRVWWDVD